MAVSLSVIAAKDSAGTAIAGGLQAQDKSGAGTGPFTLGQILIDGLAGTNMAAITAANALKVDGSAVTQPVSLSTVAVTNTGTFAVQATLAAETTKVIGVARVADGSGNLLTSTSNALNVNIASGVNANGQATMANSAPVVLASDSNGPYSATANFVSGAITTAMTGTTSTSLVAAPGASLRNYITQVTVSNAHATQGTDIVLQDGSGGTALYTIPAAAVYGGAVITFPTPLKQPTTNTALFCANVTTGASTKVSASGYKGA